MPLLQARVPIARVIDSDELEIYPMPYIPSFILARLAEVVAFLTVAPSDELIYYDCADHSVSRVPRALRGGWELEIRNYWHDPRSINFASPYLFDF